MGYDRKKDVVVKLFAEWCGRSKDLEPVFEEAAKHFIRDPSIRFIAVDVTKNEMEGINGKEFPQVLLFKSGGDGKQRVDYKGNFEDVDELIRFVNENRESEGLHEDEL